jgi:hypothetical protein
MDRSGSVILEELHYSAFRPNQVEWTMRCKM